MSSQAPAETKVARENELTYHYAGGHSYMRMGFDERRWLSSVLIGGSVPSEHQTTMRLMAAKIRQLESQVAKK